MFEKKLVLSLLICGWMIVLTGVNFSQIKTTNDRSQKNSSDINEISKTDLSDDEKREQKELDDMEKEALFYAPIRYVIVYNDIFYRDSDTGELNIVNSEDEKYREAEKSETAQRRMEILMLPQQLNRQSLVKVFELIKKRFPAPIWLEIKVHTTLATVETPEETEMAHDSQNRRFRNQENKYKKAFFLRDKEGEKFCYVTSLLPYKSKWYSSYNITDSNSPC